MRRRLRRIGLIVLAAVVVAVIVTSSILFVWPSSDRVRPVGAVLGLNGTDESQIAGLATRLVGQGVAPVLLFSEGTEPYDCPSVPGVRVVCFLPHPDKTVGEISFAASYARQHGIHSILVVAGHAQVTRARLLAHRCFPGSSYVVGASTSWSEVPGEVVYEWGALLKALTVQRSCG